MLLREALTLGYTPLKHNRGYPSNPTHTTANHIRTCAHISTWPRLCCAFRVPASRRSGEQRHHGPPRDHCCAFACAYRFPRSWYAHLYDARIFSNTFIIATNCVAHRGASADLPENTLAAFREAESQGAAGLELDLRFSADNEIVVMHDITVDRTTNCTGAVSELNYFGYLEYCMTTETERVLNIFEVFDFFLESSMVGLFDIKAEHATKPLIENICKELSNYPRELANRIFMATWTPGEVERTIASCPDSPSALVSSTLPPNPAGDYPLVAGWNIAASALLKRPNFVAEAHAAGQHVFAWTVNSVDDMNDVINIGVDSIVTDYVARCVETTQAATWAGAFLLIPSSVFVFVMERMMLINLIMCVSLCAVLAALHSAMKRIRAIEKKMPTAVVVHGVYADEKAAMV